MDDQNITIINGTNKFNFRVAVLIEFEDKVLLETIGDFWNMIGGRVHFGDSTLETAKRELKEELNINISISNFQLINVSENFFSWMGYNQQELLFIYKIIIDDSFEITKFSEFNCKDAEKIFKWHNKSDVCNLVCKPEIIKEIINYKRNITTHKIGK